MKCVIIVFLMFIISVVLYSCNSNEKRARELIKQGVEDNDLEKYDEAFLKFEKAISLKNDIPEAYYYRGNYFYNNNKLSDALADFSKALALDSCYADAYYNRGLIKKMQKDEKGACDDWLKAEKYGKPNMGDKTRWCK